jgi:hypothetical protein
MESHPKISPSLCAAIERALAENVIAAASRDWDTICGFAVHAYGADAHSKLAAVEKYNRIRRGQGIKISDLFILAAALGQDPYRMLLEAEQKARQSTPPEKHEALRQPEKPAQKYSRKPIKKTGTHSK